MAKKHMSRGTKVGIGIAATTAVAAAAGAYFLYGAKDAAKNRKAVKSWALKAKGEVLEGIEKVRRMDEKDYRALVDRVTKKYAKMRSVSSTEAAALSRELKSHWKHLHKAAVPKKTSPKKRKASPQKRRSASRKRTAPRRR